MFQEATSHGSASNVGEIQRYIYTGAVSLLSNCHQLSIKYS